MWWVALAKAIQGTQDAMRQHYEILLAPEDYTMPNLQFDKQILFDKFKTTTNPTKYK